MQPITTPPARTRSAAIAAPCVGWMSTVLCLAVLAGCGGPGPNNPQGEWAGTLHAGQGRCPDERPSRLLVDGKDLSFVPGGGVLILHGTRVPNSDRLHAQLLLADAEHKPLPMVFEGRLAPDGSRIDGTYGTPSCRATVTLTRPTDFGLQRALGN